MDDPRIAACYHPTTVILIDDEHRYLLGVKSKLNKKKAAYQLYTDPKKALHFLTQEYQPDLFTSRSVLHPEEEKSDHRSIEVDVRPIRDELYNPKRFDQVSVIIVDQEMPGLKGLELCRELKNSPIKKLMLTGEVRDEQAVQAFNDGIIDKFVNKIWQTPLLLFHYHFIICADSFKGFKGEGKFRL